MIRAYSVFIEEDLGSRTRLIRRMVHFRYNSENPCFLYGQGGLAAVLTDVTVHLSK